mgnify:CR=1 FL=1
MAKPNDVAIYFDSSLCTGCKGCQVACKQWNELPAPLGHNVTEFSGSLQSPMDLNGDTRLIQTFHEEESGNKFQPINWAIGRRSCMHCTDAACVEVCSSHALFHDKNGIVNFDTEKCNGCQYCRTACPFDVPRFRPGDHKIDKCTACMDRLEKGGIPACVKTCPTGAIHFGTKESMKTLASERVAELKTRGYDNAGLYDPAGVGGTHVMYVLHHADKPNLYHGLPENPEISETVKFWKGIWKPLAAVGFAATFAASIFHYVGVGPNRADEEENNLHEEKDEERK